MTDPVVISAMVGFPAGRLAAGWAAQVLADVPSTGLSSCQACGVSVTWRQRWLSFGRLRCRSCGQRWMVWWPLASVICTAALFAIFAWLLTDQQCQNVAEVQPAVPMHLLRLPFHLLLLFFLVTATLTDFLDYAIPDDVVIAGVLTAVTGAFVSGDLQMIHIWVNWDSQVVGLYGPYLPEWMKHHQHLHGLAWSLAGMAAGACYVALVRSISTWILGQPAMGFGDVTLMAMIGAFLGWQPVLCAIAMAPVTAVAAGTVIRVVSGRSFVAFGPYLAGSAVIVLCTWRWIWAEPLLMRNVFSHWPSVAGLVAGSLVLLAVLLAALRVFLTLPADVMRR